MTIDSYDEEENALVEKLPYEVIDDLDCLDGGDDGYTFILIYPDNFVAIEVYVDASEDSGVDFIQDKICQGVDFKSSLRLLVDYYNRENQ